MDNTTTESESNEGEQPLAKITNCSSTDNPIFAYHNSEYFKLKQCQEVARRPFNVIFSDIDNTFFRGDRKEAMAKLVTMAGHKHWPLVAVTGGGFTDVYNRIQIGELPYFHIIAGSLGTEIAVLHRNTKGTLFYLFDENYQAQLQQTSFSRTQLIALSLDLIRGLNITHPELEFAFQQPEREKNFMLGTTKDVQRFKISFHFYAAKPETVAMIERLASSIFPNHYTIICEEIGYNRGLPAKTSIRKYCLDVVAATKSTAVRYISTLTGVSEGIVAGDSGNDVDMLLENSKFHAVLVGGATSEAVSEIEKRLASKTKGSVYKMVGRNGTTKSCYVERDPKRMGPESIIEAVKALAQ